MKENTIENAITKFILADSGLALLEEFFKIKDKFTRYKDLIDEFPPLSGLKRRKNLLLNLYTYLEAVSAPPGGKGRARLFAISRDLELLGNLMPSCFEKVQKSPCRFIEIFSQDLRKEVLSRGLGTNHPLYVKIISNEETLNYLGSLFNLCDFLENRVEEQNFLRDNSLSTLARYLKAWFTMTLSLSGAFDRYCHACPRCKEKIVPGFCGLETAPERDAIYGLPAPLYESIRRMGAVANRIERFTSCRDNSISTLLQLINRIQTECRALDSFLAAEAERGTPFVRWWQAAVGFALEDIRAFFQELKDILSEMEDSFLNADSRRLTQRGLMLIKSITMEEAFDLSEKQGPGPVAQAICALYKDEDKNPALSARALAQARRELEGKEQEEGLEERARTYARKMYRELYEKYMYVPQSLKEGLLAKTVKVLQDRLSLLDSADLLNAYLGRDVSFRPLSFFAPVFASLLFPFSSRIDLKALYWIWLPTALGLCGAIYSQRFSIFILAFFSFLFVVAARLFFDGGRKNLGQVSVRSLAFGQALPGFWVPMVLALTPFVLSDELKEFVFSELNTLPEFLIWTCLFALFSFFALWKLQSPLQTGKFKNVLMIFGFLWSVSFFFSLLIPFILHNPPQDFWTTPKDNIFNIPSMVVPFGQMKKGQEIYAFYPRASIIFSFLCLFVAIFLEGLYRKDEW